jgi:hypothetical protein
VSEGPRCTGRRKMNTLSTWRKRKAEDSPQGGQKSKHSKSMLGIEPGDHPRDAPRQIEARKPMLGIGHPRDAPRKAKGAPLPKHGKTEHPREARKSMLGIEPAGHARDEPHQVEAKDTPLPKQVSGCSSKHRCFGEMRCTGAILNAEFVAAHKLPRACRKSPVKGRSADDTPSRMQGPSTQLH